MVNGDKVKFVFVFVPKFESSKKHLFLLFLRSLSITDFDNLESRKRNCCFGKKSGKSLDFWIQKTSYEP